MNFAKLSVLGLVVALVVTLGAQCVWADDAATTVSGKASCGGCSGVVEGCCLMLTDTDGGRWILRGESKSLKSAFATRHGGKTMTATYEGKPATKKDKDGKEYKEVTAKDVKIAS
jgi:hypothetical protein